LCPRRPATAATARRRARRQGRQVARTGSAGRDLLDASSSGEDVPRGLDFLLSRNRLNVAISRTQCIAYLVCSRRLLEVDCKTIEHMRLANALCRFVEIADAAVPGVSG